MRAANSSNTEPSSSLTSELTATLRDAIITGEIKQGSKLSETKLAEELDVSRGPLREAIRSLEGMNLVQHRPQHGTRVVNLSTELILQIYETRELLESRAVAHAASAMSSQEIDQLHRLLDGQSKQVKENLGAYVPAESDYAFHELLIRASGNRVIEHLLLHEIYYLIKMFRYQNTAIHTSSPNALVEHRQIVYAVEQRDTELAEVTMRRHIAHARTRIEQHLQKQPTK